jgi:hypothetical protein
MNIFERSVPFASFPAGTVVSSSEMTSYKRGNPAWVVLGVVLATLTLSVGTARANHTSFTVPENKLGFSACGWPAGKVITVAIDPAFPFPDQSYSDRLDEAIRRWEGVLSTASRGLSMVRAPGPTADVVVQYRPPAGSDPDVLAETYLKREGDVDFSPNIGRCPDRRGTQFTMQAAQIWINIRPDWFTQPDSATGVWQMCADQGFRATNGQLCSDQVDFGSTMIHELGHTLVFYHPQTLDDIDGVPVDRADSASSNARCVEATGGFDAQSTMCAGQGAWRAEQRTFETWDVETAHRHYL